MKKSSDIEERITKEVEKRVTYYENNETPESEKMSKIHYILAGGVILLGLLMTYLGARF